VVDALAAALGFARVRQKTSPPGYGASASSDQPTASTPTDERATLATAWTVTSGAPSRSSTTRETSSTIRVDV
jgi:hypothetical protein